MSNCTVCAIKTPLGHNYCSWACHIRNAEDMGGLKIQPNDLPIVSIKFDGTMLEHEHADHPDYKFPVIVEWEPKCNDGSHLECHALIYVDDQIIKTMYETQVAEWVAESGELIKHGMFMTLKKCRIIRPDLVKIHALNEGGTSA